MKLVIPVFHTEFDPLRHSINGFGKIPPIGDFGDFRWRFWRFSRQDLNRMFQNWPHFVATHLPSIMPLITLLGKFFSLSSSSRPSQAKYYYNKRNQNKINFHLGYFWITLGTLCILGTPLCLLIRLYKLGLEEPSKESIKDTKEDK